MTYGARDPRIPGPGQLVVSPALGTLLTRTGPRLLGDRFPGEVVATIGRTGLTGPGKLVVVAGHASSDLVGRAGDGAISADGDRKPGGRACDSPGPVP